MTATVYLITSGEYSDYHVEWVTFDKAVAEAAAATGYDVDEREPLTKFPRRVEELSLSCSMDRMGLMDEWEQKHWVFEKYQKAVRVTCDEARDIGQFNSDYRRSEHTIQVMGTDHELVRKVFSDRRAKALTELADFAEFAAHPPTRPVCVHGVEPVLKDEAPGYKSFQFDCPTPYECQLKAYREVTTPVSYRRWRGEK